MSNLPPRPFIALVFNPGCKSLDDCEADHRREFNRLIEAVDYCRAHLADGGHVARIKRQPLNKPAYTIWGPVKAIRRARAEG